MIVGVGSAQKIIPASTTYHDFPTLLAQYLIAFVNNVDLIGPFKT